MMNDFILPILYLHRNETIKPITPDEYFRTVDLYDRDKLLETKVGMHLFENSTSSMTLKSKAANPKKFWEQYEYDQLNNIPLYYTEETKYLIKPDGSLDKYIERSFNAFYGYNIGSWTTIGNHEADIEDFIIHYSENGIPLRIYAGAHGTIDGEWRHFKDVHLQNGRPVLYIAKGDHAFYFESSTYFRLLCCANDIIDEGILWDPPIVRLAGLDKFKGSWGNGSVSSPASSVDTEIYWQSNNSFRRIFGCGCLTSFNPTFS